MSSQPWNQSRPLLHGIERYSRKASNAAAWVTRYVAPLQSRPPFETNARATMSTAEEELRIALSAMKAAREYYDRLPATAEAAE